MSLNIHITAEGMATFPSGRKFLVKEVFPCMQTPTSVSLHIYDSADRIQAYKDWVIKDSPKQSKVLNSKLDEWVDIMKLKGLDIDVWIM